MATRKMTHENQERFDALLTEAELLSLAIEARKEKLEDLLVELANIPGSNKQQIAQRLGMGRMTVYKRKRKEGVDVNATG